VHLLVSCAWNWCPSVAVCDWSVSGLGIADYVTNQRSRYQSSLHLWEASGRWYLIEKDREYHHDDVGHKDKVVFGEERSVKHVRKVVSHRKISEGSPGQCGAQGHGRSCSTTLTVSQRPLSTEHESHRKYIESGQEVSQCSSSCRWHGIGTQV